MKIALLMYFEDELKKRVEQTVVAIENGMKSMVEFFKRICMSTAAEPQEQARAGSSLARLVSEPPWRQLQFVVFLSQIVLSVMDASSAAVAGQLVECYMSLFERALQQGEMGSRLLAALLTGVNKALPYLRSIEPIVQHVDALFQMSYGVREAS
eukprot:gene21962-22970_t